MTGGSVTDLPADAFRWRDATPPGHLRYVLPVVMKLAGAPPLRVLDAGCGNGYNAGQLTAAGFDVVAIDLDEGGLDIAREAWPDVDFRRANVEELDFAGDFDLVVSTEVVEHLYDPVAYAAGCYRALKPGGRILLSTPYHGYLKNLAISVTGGWDPHWSPRSVGGHIKFWSRSTLTALLEEAGFTDVTFRGAGRLPYLWKSDVALARR